jgi:hypothetical protein
VYGDGVNSLGENIRVMEKNTKASLLASKEVGLDVKMKRKHILISREQSAR